MTTPASLGDARASRHRQYSGHNRRSLSAAVAGMTALGSAALVPGVAAADPVAANCAENGSTVVCTYGPGAATFTAPAGVASFSVVADGAAGGAGHGIFPGGSAGVGGRGTELTGTVSTGADRTYDLLVGFSGGFNIAGSGHGAGGPGGSAPFGIGGGGGGGTSISQGSDVVLVAGGGGGSGASRDAMTGQDGRAAGSTVTPAGPDGGAGSGGSRGSDYAVGGGGGGGLVGGAGGAPGQGGSAGTSTTAGFVAASGSAGDGSLVISYQVPTSPPAPAGPSAGARARADLATSIDGPSSLALGQSGTVSVTVTNHGSDTAVRVRTHVDLPPGLRATRTGGTATYVEASLAPGQSATYTIAVTARRASATQQVVATATSRTIDSSLRDNVARRSVAVTSAP